MTEKGLPHSCIFLLNAGHQTTTSLIGNGLVALSGRSSQIRGFLRVPCAVDG